MTKTPRKAKAKTPSPAKKGQGGALMSTAELMRATGYGAPHISDLKGNGIIAPVATGKWDKLQILGAIIRRLRAKQAGDEDRQRKNKAEADTAELAALEASGKLCPMDAAKQFWSDSRIEIRQLIERADFMTPVQRTKLLAKIAALKPKEI